MYHDWHVGVCICQAVSYVTVPYDVRPVARHLVTVFFPVWWVGIVSHDLRCGRENPDSGVVFWHPGCSSQNILARLGSQAKVISMSCPSEHPAPCAGGMGCFESSCNCKRSFSRCPKPRTEMLFSLSLSNSIKLSVYWVCRGAGEVIRLLIEPPERRSVPCRPNSLCVRPSRLANQTYIVLSTWHHWVFVINHMRRWKGASIILLMWRHAGDIFYAFI